ncbi:MAG: PilZ domain-containing protein [Myxococcota bacterium]
MLLALKRSSPTPPPLPFESPGTRALRVPVLGTAAYRSEQRILIARAADVSLTGAFVATRCPDPVGTRAVLRLELEGEHVEMPVRVVRVSFLSNVNGHGAGMGLCFEALDRKQHAFLRHYVDTLQRWDCGGDAVLEVDEEDTLGIETADEADQPLLPIDADGDSLNDLFGPIL